MDARCPKCSAAVRADAQWCSLCHEDLRPPEVILAAKARAEAAHTAPSDAAHTGGRGRHAKRGTEAAVKPPAPNAQRIEDALSGQPLLEPQFDEAAGAPEGQLAMFGESTAASKELTEDDIALLRSLDSSPDAILGQWSGRLDSPTAKFGLVIGGMVVFTLGGLLFLTLAGLLLR